MVCYQYLFSAEAGSQRDVTNWNSIAGVWFLLALPYFIFTTWPSLGAFITFLAKYSRVGRIKRSGSGFFDFARWVALHDPSHPGLFTVCFLCQLYDVVSRYEYHQSLSGSEAAIEDV